MATVAELIVQQLCRAGVRALFGVPGGGSNLDLIAAAGRVGLPFVLTSTETAAAIAAIAQAEITGAPGACLTTLGPGATSVVNGVACASLERAPLIVFTDSHPASASGAFVHQRIDHRALLTPVTKSSETLTADNALQAIVRALHVATDGVPGPVHLDCPGDVAAAETVTTGAVHPVSARPGLSPVDRARLEDLLARSRKPLLLAGMGSRGQTGVAQGSHDSRGELRLADLCDRHRIPALVTYKAKGVLPDDDPWFGGVFTNASIEQPIIDDSDLLIGLGLDPVELIPRAWKRRQPIVYLGPWRVEDAHVPFGVQAVGGVAESLALLEKTLGPSEWDLGAVAGHVHEQRDHIARRDDQGFTAQRVIEVAGRALATSAARVTVDAGAHMFPATVLWPVADPRKMLISNGLSTMGFALPAAVGAALLDRDQTVVALTGDGGLLMCLGELLTAVRQGLRIITIVFSDASLSLIEIKQQARQLPSSGVALGALDWLSLARGFGVEAWSVDDEVSLDRAIAAARLAGGPTLIEAKIDRHNYGATLRAVRG
jgi:acetolactate synthase I/II/III large subunit